MHVGIASQRNTVLALIVTGLLCLGGARARAQVMDHPCASFVPMPPDVAAYRAKAAAAKQNSQPAPVPTAEEKQADELYQLEGRFNDFGGNCAYAEDNSRLPAANKERVIFFGDSITWLWKETDPGFFANNGRIDRGISGQTTSQMLVRFRQDVLDLHPAAVHILAGINDIAGNTGPTSLARIESNFTSMIEQARAQHIRVILASVLPADVIPWRPSVGNPAANVVALNTWLKAYAVREHLTYVDYYDALKDDKGGTQARYTKDGVHPSPAGFQAMEPLTRKALSGLGLPAGGAVKAAN